MSAPEEAAAPGTYEHVTDTLSDASSEVFALCMNAGVLLVAGPAHIPLVVQAGIDTANDARTALGAYIDALTAYMDANPAPTEEPE